MNRVAMALMEILAAAVVLIPIWFLMDRFVFRNGKKSAVYCLFSFYLVAVGALTGLPNITYLRFELSGNLIPLVGMVRDLKNSMLNTVLFIPLGLILPLVWEKYEEAKRTVRFGFGLSAVIELLQVFTYRATDINDLLTNGLGTVLGFLLCKGLLRIPAVKRAKREEEGYELYLVCAVAFFVMFFIQPFISRIMWDGVLY